MMHGRAPAKHALTARRGGPPSAVRSLPVLMVSLAVVSPAVSSPPQSVTSQQFHIGYAFNPEAEPLEAVELWYTQDGGTTWHRSGLDEDRRSPVAFTAPAEGLYGFLVILYNAAAASSPKPITGTQPQANVLVDYTPPVLQLHYARVTSDSDGSARIHLSWSAYDPHLAARPIEISFRRPGEPTWTPVDGPVANVGGYEWLVPLGVHGSVELRVLVRDQAGHVAVKEYSPVMVAGGHDAPAADPLAVPVSPESAPPVGGSGATAPAVPRYVAERARRLYEAGAWHLARGHLDVARERFLEALALDPTHKTAHVDLADLFLRQGAAEQAIESYRSALALEEGFPPALHGLAVAYLAQKRYSDAAASLRRVLAEDPDDARALLELGDVLLLSGERETARSCWKQVADRSDIAVEFVQEAQRRLRQDATPLP